MKITAVEKKSGNRYTVYVDGAYWYILDIELIAANKIRPGMECDEDFLEDLRRQAEVRKARERAFYLLEYRDHTKKELEEKLKRSVSPEIAAQTVERMEELGLVDDQKTAEKYAEVFVLQKRLGRRAALFQMQQKGVPRDLAEEALDLLEIDPLEQIRELIERRYARYLTDQKGVQKVTNALLRLGHDYQDIKTVIREYDSE